MKLILPTRLEGLIRSEDFQERLQQINQNYPHLKQEGHIKNALLELLNEKYFAGESSYRAFSELYDPERRCRPDLTLIQQESPENRLEIELKFQFPKDFKSFKDYAPVIQKDFEERQADLFLLIIADWKKEEKQHFYNQWKLRPTLNSYIAPDDDAGTWKANLEEALDSFESGTWENSPIQIACSSPHACEVQYYFYLLKRKDAGVSLKIPAINHPLLKDSEE